MGRCLVGRSASAFNRRVFSQSVLMVNGPVFTRSVLVFNGPVFSWWLYLSLIGQGSFSQSALACNGPVCGLYQNLMGQTIVGQDFCMFPGPVLSLTVFLNTDG